MVAHKQTTYKVIFCTAVTLFLYGSHPLFVRQSPSFCTAVTLFLYGSHPLFVRHYHYKYLINKVINTLKDINIVRKKEHKGGFPSNSVCFFLLHKMNIQAAAYAENGL